MSVSDFDHNFFCHHHVSPGKPDQIHMWPEVKATSERKEREPGSGLNFHEVGVGNHNENAKIELSPGTRAD